MRTSPPVNTEMRVAVPSGFARKPHLGYAATKRLLDIAGASVLLVLLLPLLVVIGLAIKLSSRGPILFPQSRCGLDGEPIRVLKFRTMVRDAEARLAEAATYAEVNGLQLVDAPAFKSPQDPRVTRVGRVLRRLSLDELPQLFNVLGGSMSLVGPRPLVYAEADTLDASAQVRHAVKPGITCIWQVSDRSDLSFDERMAMDAEYVARRSLWFDIWLVLKTPFAVIGGRGAY